MTTKNKEYETPQTTVINMETAPLLAASGKDFSGEGGNWQGLSDDYEVSE